jgi:hypothetical protein
MSARTGPLAAGDREPAESSGLLAAVRNARDIRRRHERIFGQDLLADPGWDLLLDLFIAEAEGRRLSIAAACLAAPVPTGTALRCIAHLADVGLIDRTADPGDHGLFYLVPTGEAAAKLALFLTPPAPDAEKSAA